jgi:hypothetical protein
LQIIPPKASPDRLNAPSGSSGRGTRVTGDGGSIMAIGYTGSAMGFSQETVQESGLCRRFRPRHGHHRSGSHQRSHTLRRKPASRKAFYFFRDHTLAAYPALKRDPANPDPFFQRRQFGFTAGGPILRDRVFFFANWERNEQRGVTATTLLTPEFAHFNAVLTGSAGKLLRHWAVRVESPPCRPPVELAKAEAQLNVNDRAGDR